MQVHLVIQAKLDGRTVALLVFQIAQIVLTVEFDKVARFVKTKPLLLTILFNDRGQLDVDGCNFLDPSHPPFASFVTIILETAEKGDRLGLISPAFLYNDYIETKIKEESNLWNNF